MPGTAAGRAVALSLGVFVAGCCVAMAALDGLFTDRPGSCGDFGFRCLGHALVVFGIATAIGIVAALVAFARSGPRKWLNWAALLVNGGAPVALLVWFFLI